MALSKLDVTEGIEMVARIQERRCLWPKFSSYRLRDGRILAAEGAKLSWYDPWAKYTEARTQDPKNPPHVSLVSLVQQFVKEWQERGQNLVEAAAAFQVDQTAYLPPVPEQSVKAILAWSAEHGPLGVFHQTTIYLEEPAGDRAWAWINGRWNHQSIWPPRLNRQDRTCLVSGITDSEQQRWNARHYLRRFLSPDIPEELPAPDSETFFALYGEHLWDWLWAAITTVEAIDKSHSWGLNLLTGSAARIRHFKETPVRTEMVFRSLLSAFAEMYGRDSEEGIFIRHCAECGVSFTTDRRWTKHCGTRCATKARQRRFLEKNPDYYKAVKGGRRT